MSYYKLLTQMMDYKSQKDNYTLDEQIALEKKFAEIYDKLSKTDISHSIINFIDGINDN